MSSHIKSSLLISIVTLCTVPFASACAQVDEMPPPSAPAPMLMDDMPQMPGPCANACAGPCSRAGAAGRVHAQAMHQSERILLLALLGRKAGVGRVDESLH